MHYINTNQVIKSRRSPFVNSYTNIHVVLVESSNVPSISILLTLRMFVVAPKPNLVTHEHTTMTLSPNLAILGGRGRARAHVCVCVCVGGGVYVGVGVCG